MILHLKPSKFYFKRAYFWTGMINGKISTVYFHVANVGWFTLGVS